VLNILEGMRTEYAPPYMALAITHQGKNDLTERRFFEMLIEDRVPGMHIDFEQFMEKMRRGIR